MTNTTIITNALKARGMTDDQLSQLLTAYNGDLPFHTAPEWSRRGYHIKTDAAPLFTCDLWKHTDKPSRAAIAAAEEAGEEVPENSPHFYKKRSDIYSFAQVEKNAPAPDLATIKARLDSLPGLTYKVKGEKTGSPNVWITAGADAHAETIKALGGIWSKKKSAYWIKPGTATAPAEDKPAAPVPAMTEDAPAAPAPMQARPAVVLPPVRLALPAPARLLALPAPKADPEPAPAPVPGPWKKCSFYTIRRDKGDDKPTPHKVDGYTDGVYNYYSIGDKRNKIWHAIHPVYGLSIVWKETRQATQARALELADSVRKLDDGKDARLQAYADAIRAAQDGGNLSLF